MRPSFLSCGQRCPFIHVTSNPGESNDRCWPIFFWLTMTCMQTYVNKDGFKKFCVAGADCNRMLILAWFHNRMLQSSSKSGWLSWTPLLLTCGGNGAWKKMTAFMFLIAVDNIRQFAFVLMTDLPMPIAVTWPNWSFFGARWMVWRRPSWRRRPACASILTDAWPMKQARFIKVIAWSTWTHAAWCHFFRVLDSRQNLWSIR